MVPMPPNYLAQLRKTGTTPDTLFNYPEVRERSLDYNILSLYMVDGTTHGKFRLNYMLKSYKRVTDNFEFGLFMITSDGIFQEVEMHYEYNVPFEFQTMVLQRVCNIDPGMFITNLPNTRKIIFLKDTRYTEIINGYAYPNTFYFEDGRFKKEDIKSHRLLIESSNYEPIEIEWEENIYICLRNQVTYIHLRADQYVDVKDIRFWHMGF